MGKTQSRIAICAFVVSLCLITFATVSTAGDASWLGARYTPVEDQVESIPIRQIDKSWSKVLVLTKANQPEDVLRDLERNKHYAYQFQLEGDFNGDEKRDKALVGVYVDNSGQVGRFLLILTVATPGRWKKAFLYKVPGVAGFSILRYEKGQVTFSTCMECDTFGDLIWKRGRNRISWYSTR